MSVEKRIVAAVRADLGGRGAFIPVFKRIGSEGLALVTAALEKPVKDALVRREQEPKEEDLTPGVLRCNSCVYCSDTSEVTFCHKSPPITTVTATFTASMRPAIHKSDVACESHKRKNDDS